MQILISSSWNHIKNVFQLNRVVDGQEGVTQGVVGAGPVWEAVIAAVCQIAKGGALAGAGNHWRASAAAEKLLACRLIF